MVVLVGFSVMVPLRFCMVEVGKLIGAPLVLVIVAPESRWRRDRHAADHGRRMVVRGDNDVVGACIEVREEKLTRLPGRALSNGLPCR